VDAVVRDALAAVRGDGPRFVHALTYRLSGHTAADAAGYRESGEVAEHWRQDPIARAAAMLVDTGMAAAELEDIRNEAAHAMSTVLDEARASPWPEDRHAHTDVQDSNGPGHGQGQGLERSA
jgi:pyruvate dehydrogenase E1 component alpha subunit